MPSHPYSDSKGYVPEHRVTMEEYLKCYLDPKKHFVHHRNGDRADNCLENLEVMSPSEHSRFHSYNRSIGDGECWDKSKRWWDAKRGMTWIVENGKRKWIPKEARYESTA